MQINNTHIEQVTEVKLLGVYIDNKLSWSKHIEFITKSMGKSVAAVRRCRQYLPVDLMKLVARTLIISHLDYCPIIWANAKQKDLYRLQLMQNKAARVA